ncbi:FH2 domain-containing protein 1-like [Narcine bancroftii]|uniref:FH2 domain-containing protein 1-like n=1 Tax=Narcine bancroftii TaxID=1343680 RepID=UPI003831603C
MGTQNIWTVEKDAEQITIDTRRMEELFARSETLTVSRMSSRATSPQRARDTEVSILDAKKSINIGIFLKQFKRPVHSIVADIEHGDGASYGAEKLVALRTLLPGKEEVKMLREFKGDRGRVGEAELFLLLLVQLPSYEERLESLILKEEFAPLLKAVSVSTQTMILAARELLDCEELHTVIRLVLKAGNYMNAGGYAGNAVGFRMASLLKLADTRANKPGINLMHFVAMEAEKNNKKLLDFPNKLQNIEAASRIYQQDTVSDFQKLKHKLGMVKGNLDKLPELQEQMKLFIQGAERQLQEVQGAMDELQTVTRQLCDYLCEDSDGFQLQKCCSIFRSFSQRFLTAREENQQRREQEERRRLRESSLKRLSIASCSHREREPFPGHELETLLLGDRRLSRQRPASERLVSDRIPRSQSLQQLGIRGPALSPPDPHLLGSSPQDLSSRHWVPSPQGPSSLSPLAATPPSPGQVPFPQGPSSLDTSGTVPPGPSPISSPPGPPPPGPSCRDPSSHHLAPSYTDRVPSPDEVRRLREASQRLLGPQAERASGPAYRPSRPSSGPFPPATESRPPGPSIPGLSPPRPSPSGFSPPRPSLLGPSPPRPSPPRPSPPRPSPPDPSTPRPLPPGPSPPRPSPQGPSSPGPSFLGHRQCQSRPDSSPFPLAQAGAHQASILGPSPPPWLQSLTTVGSQPKLSEAGRSLSADTPELSRGRPRLRRGLSVDRPKLPAALRRRSSSSSSSTIPSSSSTRPFRPFASTQRSSSVSRRAEKAVEVEGPKASGPSSWTISSLFGKKPVRAAAGAGAVVEEEMKEEPVPPSGGMKEEPVPPSGGMGFISSLLKRFSDHRATKHRPSPPLDPSDPSGAGDGSAAS